jgi:HK97 gp10 family phage protein
MGRYRSLSDYAKHLERVVVRMPVAKAKGLALAGKVVAEKTRNKLGVYQSGWPPLKPETVARKATGDSPELETGSMRDTIAVKADAVKATISVGGAAIYQELGTSKMPARPFLGPALRESEGKIGAALAGEIDQNLRSR